jgi:ribosomal-protein-serine acetyltransferase
VVLQVTTQLRLELLDIQHAQPLFNLIEANRDYLRNWLPWVDQMNSIDEMNQYVETCKQKSIVGTEQGFVLFYENEIIGRNGIYKIDENTQTAEIGYWIAEPLQGKGLIASSCKQLLQLAFTNLQLNEIEISCNVANKRSKAIPEQLGFKFKKITPKAEFLNGAYADLIVYSLLKENFTQLPQ